MCAFFQEMSAVKNTATSASDVHHQHQHHQQQLDSKLRKRSILFSAVDTPTTNSPTTQPSTPSPSKPTVDEKVVNSNTNTSTTAATATSTSIQKETKPTLKTLFLATFQGGIPYESQLRQNWDFCFCCKSHLYQINICDLLLLILLSPFGFRRSRYAVCISSHPNYSWIPG